MVLTGDNSCKSARNSWATGRKRPFSSLTRCHGQWLRIEYDSYRSLSVNRSIQRISSLTLEAQQAALDFIKPGDCAWVDPLLTWSQIWKSWLRRVLQPPSRSRYRYGCPRIPFYHGERHGHRRKACVSLLNYSIYILSKVGVRIEDCGVVTKSTSLQAPKRLAILIKYRQKQKVESDSWLLLSSWRSERLQI